MKFVIVSGEDWVSIEGDHVMLGGLPVLAVLPSDDCVKVVLDSGEYYVTRDINDVVRVTRRDVGYGGVLKEVKKLGWNR